MEGTGGNQRFSLPLSLDTSLGENRGELVGGLESVRSPLS